MKKSTKILVFILAVALVIGITTAFAIVAGATGEIPELSVDGCNLSFENSIYIKYAVKSNVSDVKLLIWREAQTEYTKDNADATLTSIGTENIGGTDYVIFKYTSLAAKEMCDVVYARAYTTSGTTDYYSNLKKYSILQYVYNMTGKTGVADEDENFKTLLLDMLSYGASAQKYFGYNTDRLATMDFYEIKLASGLISDGSNHGLYLTGDKVTITAPENDSTGATFSYWKDSDGNKAYSTATAEVTVGEKNEIYTPVYVKYSEGLEFETNDDGTCYLVGIGDCTDTDIIVPPTALLGDTVIGIDSKAFSGEAIVSISIPSSIEEIGSNAFKDCTSLTDVYYDGSKADFEEKVAVSRGNDYFLDATFHYSVSIAYTVTFVDYNGETLKTERVAEGASATAPANPERSGYNFTGWDTDFTNVTSNLTVTATYEEITYTEPTIVVNNVTANAGDTVTVVVNVKNNPGILAMTLSLTYDDSALELISASNGTALSTLTMTASKTLASGCKFGWDGIEIKDEDVADGEILVLTFAISDSAASGTYDIEILYTEGDIYDNDINPLSFEIKNGTITVN